MTTRRHRPTRSGAAQGTGPAGAPGATERGRASARPAREPGRRVRDPFARLRTHLPRQQRSRRTLTALLDAGESVLGEAGIEGATVPAIAKRAGLSVGVVYRRFPDKEALLQAVFARFFQRLRERNAAVLRPGIPPRTTLPVLARAIIAGMIEGYRTHRGVLRPFLIYTRSHPDSTFRRHAQELTREALPQVADLLLVHRDAMRHPDPEAAVRFGLTAVALAAQSIVILEDPLPAAALPPAGSVADELTRMFLGYLGVRD